MSDRLTAEQVMDDAETTALYFRSLLDKGVPIMAAISLTSSYISGISIGRAHRELPDKPWEQG